MPVEGLGDSFTYVLALPGRLLLDLYNSHGVVSASPDSQLACVGGVESRERRFPTFGSVGYVLARWTALSVLRTQRRSSIDSTPDWPPVWLGQLRFLETQNPLVDDRPVTSHPASKASDTTFRRGAQEGSFDRCPGVTCRQKPPRFRSAFSHAFQSRRSSEVLLSQGSSATSRLLPG